MQLYDTYIKGTTLDTITDPVKLGQLLPGIKPSDVAAIPANKAVATVVNIFTASSTYGIYMTSPQVFKSWSFFENVHN